MSTVNIEVLHALKQMGASEANAETIAAEISKINPDQLATKIDLIKLESVLHSEITATRVALESDITDTKTALESEIADTRTILESDIADLKAELKSDITELRVELKGDTADVKGSIKAVHWALGLLIVINTSVLMLILKIIIN